MLLLYLGQTTTFKLNSDIPPKHGWVIDRSWLCHVGFPRNRGGEEDPGTKQFLILTAKRINLSLFSTFSKTFLAILHILFSYIHSLIIILNLKRKPVVFVVEIAWNSHSYLKKINSFIILRLLIQERGISLPLCSCFMSLKIYSSLK